MSAYVSIICDECGRIMDDGKTAQGVRRAIREHDREKSDGRRARLALPGGRDLCWECAPTSKGQGT